MYSWKKLLQYKPIEFNNQVLEVVSGKLPENLEGTLYRNTSALFERKNGLPGHLFDGDGAILKVTFSKHDRPIGSYRFVQTKGFQEEEAKNGNFSYLSSQEFIYANLGRTATGNRFTKMINSFNFKNSANTSVLPLKNGPLLSLWEGGEPHSLEKYSLNTLGLFNTKTPFSAHPKVCSRTNQIFNIGVEMGKTTYLHAYEMDQTGRILKQNKVQIQDGQYMVHDFALAGKYLVIPVYPILVDKIFDIMTGGKTIGQDAQFAADRGIEIILFDREDNLKLVSRSFSKEIYYVWHYSNGYVDDDGTIVIEQSAYKNFDSYKNFHVENLLKGMDKETFRSQHQRVMIDPKTAQILKRVTLHDESVEFLVVDDADVGQKWDTTYGVSFKSTDDWPNAIIRYQGKNRILKTYDVGLYVSEPIYVQNKELDKGIGWLIVPVYDGNQDKTFIEILDSRTLETQCKLLLPFNISLSFHGRFDAI